MKIVNRYIVMTAAAHMPNSCWGKYGRVAVIETDGVNMPKQIHPKHSTVKKIVRVWERRNIGTTSRCAFSVAIAEANKLALELNTNLEE